LAALASKGQDYVAGYQQGHGIRTHMAAGVAAGEAAGDKTGTLADAEKAARKRVDNLKARGYAPEHKEMQPRIAAHQAASSALEAAAAERVGANDQLLRNVVMPHISAVEGGKIRPPKDPATNEPIENHTSAWARNYDPKQAKTQQSAVHGRLRKILSQIDDASQDPENQDKDQHDFHPADMVSHLAQNTTYLIRGAYAGLDLDPDQIAAGELDRRRAATARAAAKKASAKGDEAKAKALELKAIGHENRANNRAAKHQEREALAKDTDAEGDDAADLAQYVDTNPANPTGVIGVKPEHLKDIMNSVKFVKDLNKPGAFDEIADALDPLEGEDETNKLNGKQVELAYRAEINRAEDRARADRTLAGKPAPEDFDADGKPLPMGPQTLAVAHKMGIKNIEADPAQQLTNRQFMARSQRASMHAQGRKKRAPIVRTPEPQIAPAEAPAEQPATPANPAVGPDDQKVEPALANAAQAAPDAAQAAPAEAPAVTVKKARKLAQPDEGLTHRIDTPEHNQFKAALTKRIMAPDSGIFDDITAPGDKRPLNYKKLFVDMLNHEKGFSGRGSQSAALAKQGFHSGSTDRTLADGTVLKPLLGTHKGHLTPARQQAKVRALAAALGEGGVPHFMWLKYHEDLATRFGEILAEWLRDNIEMNDEDIEESVLEFVQQLQEAAEAVAPAEQDKDDDVDPAVKAANDEDKAAKLTTDASLDVSGDEQLESSLFDGLIERSLFAGLVKKESMFDDLTTRPSLFDGIVSE
jgi:hypothetical protein